MDERDRTRPIEEIDPDEMTKPSDTDRQALGLRIKPTGFSGEEPSTSPEGGFNDEDVTVGPIGAPDHPTEQLAGPPVPRAPPAVLQSSDSTERAAVPAVPAPTPVVPARARSSNEGLVRPVIELSHRATPPHPVQAYTPSVSSASQSRVKAQRRSSRRFMMASGILMLGIAALLITFLSQKKPEPIPIGVSELPLHVSTTPAGTQVEMAGRLLGSTPLDTRIEAPFAPIELILSHPGYATKRIAVTPGPDGAFTLDVALDRLQ